MSFEKENINVIGRYLSILGSNACLRKVLPNITNGKWHLFLDRADTCLSVDIRIVMEVRQGCWQVEGRTLNANCPFYFYVDKREKLLFLLSEKVEEVQHSEKVFLKNGESIKIGNSYTNQIFYDCFSFMESVHAEIIFDEQKGIILNSEQEGVYVNEKILKGQMKLGTGDRIDIYGLHLLILKELIICVFFCGVCRVAGSRVFSSKLQGKKSNRKEEKVLEEYDRQAYFIERNCNQDEELYTGEIEIIMPDKPMQLPNQSLFLSLGPTLTMVLPMLLMAQLSSHYMGEMGSGFYYLSVVMSGCTALLAVFWGLVNHEYSKYCRRREEREKERQYREYLKGIENELLICQNENRRILEQRYPPITELFGEEKEAAKVYWNRYYRQKDFLFLRFGVGKMDFHMKIKLPVGRKGILQGKLEREAEKLAKSFLFLTQVPVGVDLFKDRQVGMFEKDDKKQEKGKRESESSMKEVLLQMLLQIMACHCYTEVKMVCFYHKERTFDREIADCLRWAPHCWSADRRTRYLAGNEQETAEILPILNRELVKAAANAEKEIRIPWYVVIVLNEELIMGEAIYQYLTDPEACYPVSAIFIGKQREMLPKSCRYFLTCKEQNGEILNLGNERINRQYFQPDTCNFLKAQDYARRITNVRVRGPEVDDKLPEQVDFLQLYGCCRIEELESGNRWKMARPEERLKAVIGCRAGGNLISLDIHEKFHGPHGLVAGTTGSGKSELLQTYLLSMAISYSPADVNFFMIDYKGGGTGNVLRGLPHCAGVISNLSGNQIKRAMSAISSENKRRQKLLGEFQVNHIDAYSRLFREGKVEKPMPHLILVVDEFAELKKEEPEFMQEIISLSQVGRSLGVHLILATQKPAGIVDDKIWSNARFRMCLRVQDNQDSMDMLKNGDAAKLTAPGQCYIQIGNQEYYELFQAGYCGGVYTEGGDEKAKVVLVSETGRRKERKAGIDTSNTPSLIQMLIDYVSRTAIQYRYEAAPQLWMPELPDKVVVEELQKWEEITKKNETGELLNPTLQIILGLCDDPENQQQFLFIYEPMIQGHLVVCGGPGTGKTTLLQTILWQLCSAYTPKQVQVLAVSLGQESFGSFLYMPECLGVLKNKKDTEVFFYHLKELIDHRRSILAGIGCQQYNRSGAESLPYIFLVIDNFSILNRELEEKQEELILKLASEGISLGIYLIISATALGEMSGRLLEKIKTTIALEMSDRFQYGDVLRQYYLPVLPKENTKGRGLCKVKGKVLEFQGALAIGEMEDYERIHMIAEEGKRKENEMHSKKISIPEKFPVLPEKPEFHMLVKKYVWSGEKIPIGYSLSNGRIREISPEEMVCFLISGNEKTGRTTFISCMIEGFLNLGGRVVVIDGKGKLKYFSERHRITYLRNNEEIENWRKSVIVLHERERNSGSDPEKSMDGDKKRITGVFISDLGDFCRFLYEFGDERQERVRFWERLAMGKQEGVFLAGVYNPVRDGEAAGNIFFREFAAWRHGICLGGNVAAQRVFEFDDLSYAMQSRCEPPGTGYFKAEPGSITEKLLLPMYEKEAKSGR